MSSSLKRDFWKDYGEFSYLKFKILNKFTSSKRKASKRENSLEFLWKKALIRLSLFSSRYLKILTHLKQKSSHLIFPGEYQDGFSCIWETFPGIRLNVIIKTKQLEESETKRWSRKVGVFTIEQRHFTPLKAKFSTN